jgi:hypothetical protein
MHPARQLVPSRGAPIEETLDGCRHSSARSSAALFDVDDRPFIHAELGCQLGLRESDGSSASAHPTGLTAIDRFGVLSKETDQSCQVPREGVVLPISQLATVSE